MDPISALGLAASAAQVAEYAGNVFINLYRYCQEVKDAPALSAELRDEVAITLSLLNALPSLLSSRSSLSSAHVSALKTALAGFRRTLEKLENAVQPQATTGVQKLKWPFSKDKNERLIAKIERYKVAFGLALSIEHRLIVFSVN